MNNSTKSKVTKKEESKMGKSKKEETNNATEVEKTKASKDAPTTPIINQSSSQNKPQNKKSLIALIIIFIIGILIVVGIIVVPKILEAIEESNEDSESNEVTETLEVKIVPSYNEEIYVIEGIPDTFKVEITGKKKAVEKAKENSDTKINLDLSEYKPSKDKTKVKLNFNCPDKVECEVKPSSIKISVQDKVSATKKVKYEIIENELLEQVSIKSVSLSQEEAIVRGGQDTLDTINHIKALIDLKDLIDTSASDMLQTGERRLNNIKLVAYDKEGNKVDNIEIVPSTMSATIEITSNSKEIPIDLNLIGQLAEGRAISSITINGTDFNSYKVKVFGDEETVKEITSIPLTIDMEGQGNDELKTLNVTLSKPVRITKIVDEDITIEFKFTNAKQKTFELYGIQAINVADDLTATLASLEDYKIKVELIGAPELIDNFEINDSNISAYVDLTRLNEDMHTVPVQIDIKDPRIKCIIDKNIEIKLNKQ